MSTYVEGSIFQRIITGDDVEQACMATLHKWSSTYLAEVERQHGITAGTLQRPRGWVTAPSFDKWPEDQLPAVMVISVGLSELPLKDGAGTYRARWQMGLGCIVSARTEAESHRLAMLYVAAHRALLIQRPSLGSFASGVVWQDEDYTQLPYDDNRSLGAGLANFTVEVQEVTSWQAGPTTPDEPLDPDILPWPPWQQVLTHEEQVENYPPPQSLPPDED